MRIGLHLYLLLFCALSSTLVLATTYTFTGGGAWSDKGNWSAGMIPPHYNKTGDTILIEGQALTTDICSDGVCFNDIEGNFGTLIIAAGGSLTIRNPTQFSSGGVIIIYGSLINKTIFEGYDTQSITIYGTLINQRGMGNMGTITIKEDGVLQNEGRLGNDNVGIAKIILHVGGLLKNTGSMNLGIVDNKGGTISNTALFNGGSTVHGDLTSDSGTLAPGGTNAYGDVLACNYNISGDYKASRTSAHTFGVAGTADGFYSTLNVGGMVHLNGTLKVSLEDGFLPTTNHDIPIIKGSITGTFSQVDIPSRYTLVYETNGVVLRSMPLQPVEFKEFSALKSGDTAVLTWTVQNEQDVLQYEVERSTDGQVYAKIGTVLAANASQYTFSDAQPQTFNYYRIKGLHKDGFYRYSSLANLTFPLTVNTFSGDGDWSDALKWSNGTVPHLLMAGERLIIKGKCNFDLFEFTTNGEILISDSSTLFIEQTEHKLQFYQHGTLIIKGRVDNTGDYFENMGTLQVFGTFINASYFINYGPNLTIEDGGKFINTTGNTFVSEEITIKGDGAFINEGTIAGNVTFEGNISNGGILAPGSSPGTVQVKGDYTATPTAVHNFEVGGISNGAYDLLSTTGDVHLDGALNVSLINGFEPSGDHEVTIIQGMIKGTFSKVTIPGNYTLVYRRNAVVLKAVRPTAVTFTTVTVIEVENRRVLHWEVGAETNLDGYDVERRVEGSNYKGIGFVEAQGKSQYSFTDLEPVQGVVYYRIRFIGEDGTFDYSNEVSLKSNGNTALKVFPVPVHKTGVTLQHRAVGASSLIRILSEDGRLVKQIRPERGSLQTPITLNSFAQGLYVIQLNYGNGIVETVKLIVQ